MDTGDIAEKDFRDWDQSILSFICRQIVIPQYGMNESVLWQNVRILWQIVRTHVTPFNHVNRRERSCVVALW